MNAMLGYIWDSKEHGAFAPSGKVEMTPEQIEAHNSELMALELAAMKETGKATLYLFNDAVNGFSVGTWSSKDFQRTRVESMRKSRNNFGADRLDVWFYADGSRWHGVNLGDNDIVRCKRCKC